MLRMMLLRLFINPSFDMEYGGLSAKVNAIENMSTESMRLHLFIDLQIGTLCSTIYLPFWDAVLWVTYLLKSSPHSFHSQFIVHIHSVFLSHYVTLCLANLHCLKPF